MVVGNTVVVLVVIALVFCVLSLVFAAMYYLDKAVNRSATPDVDERSPASGETFRVHEIGKKAPAEERSATVSQLRSEAR